MNDPIHPKFNKPMKTYWDSFQGSYQMGPQKHRVYLLDLLKEKGVETLFDVGMGTAPIFDLIVNEKDGRWDNIKKYKGTDYSYAMVDIAKEMFPYGNFEVQDARKLTEGSSTWDCVLLMHVLDHLDDYKAAIREATRVSKKYVLIVLWRGFVNEGTNLNDRNTMGKEEGEKPWQDTYLHEYSKEVLDEAFKEAGLTVEKIADGEEINSDQSKYNWLCLLSKNEEQKSE